MHRRALALTLAVVVSGCSSSTPASRTSHADDEAAVSAAMDQYVATLRTNDATKILSWWTQDAVLIAKNGPTLTGRATMEPALKGMLSTMQIAKVTLDRDELSVSGDLAYIVGRYDEVLQPPKGDPVPNRGRAIYIWKRQSDGSWKIARIVATDLAAAPPARTAAKDSSAVKGG